MINVLYFIFFGFLLTTIFGLLTSWLDRKVTARLQYRVGPPILQPIIDIIKLFGKETQVPSGASKIVFIWAPLIGFLSTVLASTILWINNLKLTRGFSGDIVILIFLLIIPLICLIAGGFASRNPFASLGARREIKLILVSEFAFVIAFLVPIIKSGYVIKIGHILAWQAQHGIVIGNISGILALLVALICIQAKLGLVPFDMREAETEISGGVLIEYSGALLAVYKLTRDMFFFTLPFFIMILFMGGFKVKGIHLLYSILEYIGLVAFIIVLRNTNPRVRIDQAMRFFLGPVTVVAVIAVVLALVGR